MVRDGINEKIDFPTDLLPAWSVARSGLLYPGWAIGGFQVVQLSDRCPAGAAPHFCPVPGLSIAHETGHNHGLGHVPCDVTEPGCFIDPVPEGTFCSPAPPYEPYPYEYCELGPLKADGKSYYGFDPRYLSAVTPDTVRDMMAYGDNGWPSDYTTRKFLDSMKPQNPVDLPGAEAVVLVSGKIEKGKKVSPEPLLALAVDEVPASTLATHLGWQKAPREGTPWKARMVGADGLALGEYALFPMELRDAGEVAELLQQYVPLPEGTVRLDLLAPDGSLTSSQERTPHEPDLAIVSVDSDDDLLQLVWSANDLDPGDSLTYLVRLSTDGGKRWETLRSGLEGTIAWFDMKELPASDAARLQVIATDGFNTAVAVSEPFSIEASPVQVLLGGVGVQEQLPFGAERSLLAMAYLPGGEPLAAENVAWEIVGASGGASFSGASVRLPVLAPGAYVATASAVSEDGATGKASREFSILPVHVAEQPSPHVDGLCGEQQYRDATAFLATSGAGQTIRAYLLHADGELHVCLADLPLSPNWDSVAGILIDPDGSADSVPGPGDRALLVDQGGYRRVFEAVDGALAADIWTELDFEAASSAETQTWSAELAIPDELLGGWGHPAGIGLVFADSADPAWFQLWPPNAQFQSPSGWASIWLGEVPPKLNQAPLADPGPDQVRTLDEAAEMFLDGSGSFDPDGDSISYSWSQMEGPEVTLEEPSAGIAGFLMDPVEATVVLRFQLVVDDGQLESIPSEVTLTIHPGGAGRVGCSPDEASKPWLADEDGDGFGSEETGAMLEACAAPVGYVLVSGDCDDSDGDVYPSAEEIVDGKDNDCDGLVDNPGGGDPDDPGATDVVSADSSVSDIPISADSSGGDAAAADGDSDSPSGAHTGGCQCRVGGITSRSGIAWGGLLAQLLVAMAAIGLYRVLRRE